MKAKRNPKKKNKVEEKVEKKGKTKQEDDHKRKSRGEGDDEIYEIKHSNSKGNLENEIKKL
jgi:hypothetical protein